jgi:hypothetical protein
MFSIDIIAFVRIIAGHKLHQIISKAGTVTDVSSYTFEIAVYSVQFSTRGQCAEDVFSIFTHVSWI